MPKTNAQIRIDLEAENTRLKAQRNELRAVVAQTLGEVEIALSELEPIMRALLGSPEFPRTGVLYQRLEIIQARLANPHETEETQE